MQSHCLRLPGIVLEFFSEFLLSLVKLLLFPASPAKAPTSPAKMRLSARAL